MKYFHHDGDDDATPKNEEDKRNLEAGDYDLGDELGTKVGEHDAGDSVI